MKKIIVLLAAFTLAASAVSAQALPRKVKDVTLLDLNGKATTLPGWGEKNLMIFYIDPDHSGQNEDFTDELEANHRAQGDNILGFGIMNLDDAPMVPNSLARKMAAKRTATNHATVLADQNSILSSSWNLGDCNNKFVLLIVTKEGELVFMRKGELSEQDKADFYKAIENYK